MAPAPAPVSTAPASTVADVNVDVDGIFEEAADVVVVGTGAAGLAAAVAAASRGASVIVLESADHPGGTTAKSGGTAWIPNNHLMRERGVADDRAAALRYMARRAHPDRCDPDRADLGLDGPDLALLEAFYDRGPEALADLVALGAMEAHYDGTTPDYHLDDNAAPYGRRVAQRGTTVEGAGGPALIDGLLARAVDLGATVRLGHRVVDVLANGAGAVVGVEARAGHRTVLVRARRAVVFGSGGFAHNPDLADRYLRGHIYGGCAAAHSRGDFVQIGVRLGAALGNMENAWWHQVPLEQALRTPELVDGIWVPYGDAMVQVNRYGVRVVDEKAPYNERTKVHFTTDPATGEQPNRVLLHLYDDRAARDPSPMRYPVPPPGEPADYVISGDSWADLADRVDHRLADLADATGGVRLHDRFLPNLQATVARFDQFARRGVDDDFGRGTLPISHKWNFPNLGDTPDPTMRPFPDDGPFHCILLVAGALDTKGGPRTNPAAQVVDADGRPIPGLYGAGNCVASPAGQGYWGAGGTIGPALVFGWLAGRGAAAEPDKSLDGLGG